jgi:hypothetical protein
MSRLQNRLIGPYSRQFSPNSPAIRSQILKNLASNNQFFVTARQVRQTSDRQAESRPGFAHSTLEVFTEDGLETKLSKPEKAP